MSIGLTDSASVRFYDSAAVNRAVFQGYVKVGNTRVSLSEEDKKALSETDKEAQKQREMAYAKYITEHEAAVARQQREALASAYKKLPKGLEIFARQNKGVSWNDFEWKSYETRVNVSLGNTPQIESVEMVES